MPSFKEVVGREVSRVRVDRDAAEEGAFLFLTF